MGCDIHVKLEVKISGKWMLQELAEDIFDCRNYGLFGFLADVRNYSKVPPLKQSTGWPSDITKSVIEWERSYRGMCEHSHTCITLKELLEFDYDQTFEDRRICKQVKPNFFDGAALADEGEGRIVTYREFLGEWFFNDLSRMERFLTEEITDKDIRLLIFFDN